MARVFFPFKHSNSCKVLHPGHLTRFTSPESTYLGAHVIGVSFTRRFCDTDVYILSIQYIIFIVRLCCLKMICSTLLQPLSHRTSLFSSFVPHPRLFSTSSSPSCSTLMLYFTWTHYAPPLLFLVSDARFPEMGGWVHDSWIFFSLSLLLPLILLFILLFLFIQ